MFNINSSKNEIVTVFLSILELIRTKYIKIFQEGNFSEIIISKRVGKMAEMLEGKWNKAVIEALLFIWGGDPLSLKDISKYIRY